MNDEDYGLFVVVDDVFKDSLLVEGSTVPYELSVRFSGGED